MDWQTYTAAGIVAITALIFLIRAAKRPGKSNSCGHSCACHQEKRNMDPNLGTTGKPPK